MIYQIRNTTRFVSYKDIKPLMADLKRVYAAVDEPVALAELDRFEELWGKKYPKTVQSWRANWAGLSTYFKYPAEVRKIIYEKVSIMANTRIISMHMNCWKTVAQCLTDRTEYAKNPEKTKDGELISAYACDAKTVDAEFLLAKRQYHTITGREQKNDVIAYQIRQSFKPGEVSPEDANQLGYELAMRFLKGKHAFIVATHCDKQHIHNHIIFNATTLGCHGKFRDFLGFG